jgi:hypothetical protein
MTTTISILRGLGLALPLTLAACAADPTTESEEATADEQNAAGPRTDWVRVFQSGGSDRCAQSIGVAASEAVWIATCDSKIMYRDPRPDFPEFRDANKRGTQVHVQQPGEAVVLGEVERWGYATWWEVEGRFENGIAVPDTRWHRSGSVVTADPCLSQVVSSELSNGRGNAIWFTSFTQANFQAADLFFGIACETDRLGHSRIMRATNGTIGMEATSMTTQGGLLSIWGNPNDNPGTKTLVVLDTQLRWYNEATNTEHAFSMPPGFATWVTDHHVLTSEGIFRFSDEDGEWKFLISSQTPTGTITQITHAPPERTNAGTFLGSNPLGGSAVWALDDSGAIYYAFTTTPPR